MESRGPEDSKNVKTSQAYFFEGFISFFEDFSLTSTLTHWHAIQPSHTIQIQGQPAVVLSTDVERHTEIHNQPF